MSVPTEPGYYWARIYQMDPEWEPIRLNDSLKTFFAFENEMSEPVEDIAEWGDRIERGTYAKGFKDGQFDARYGSQAMDMAGSPLDHML